MLPGGQLKVGGHHSPHLCVGVYICILNATLLKYTLPPVISQKKKKLLIFLSRFFHAR